MFIIMHKSGLYFHNKGRIILFESEQEANNFIKMFVQYSIERLVQEGREAESMKAMFIPHECNIVQSGNEIFQIKCGTVFARELFDMR